jgi:transcriptional regulator with XRE-family HTH domain
MLQTFTPNTFKDRLNHLFASTSATYRDVVDGTGGVVREAYLWQLRTGRAINPSYKVIAALASYFHVRPGYFFGEEDNSGIARFVNGLNEDERRIAHRIAFSLLFHT